MIRPRTLLPALLLAAASARAQTMPDARSIIDRYTAAIGGRDLWLRTDARSDSGLVVLDGDSSMYQRHWSGPASWALSYDRLKEATQNWNGYDGRLAWYEDVFDGGSLLHGADSVMYAVTGRNASLFEAGTYRTARTTGDTTLAGEPAWIVRIEHNDVVTRSIYFSKSSGLRLGERNPNSSGERLTLIQTWGTFEGRRVPTAWTVTGANLSRTFVVTQVRFVPVEARLLRAPVIANND
jgi:hypothetical protein